MNKFFSVVLVFVFLNACSQHILSPEEQTRLNQLNEKAKDVGIVYSLTASKVNNYRDLGPVECKIYWKNMDEIPEELCRNKIKFMAAELGGTLIVIEKKTNIKCTAGLQEDDCVEMKGRVYSVKI